MGCGVGEITNKHETPSSQEKPAPREEEEKERSKREKIIKREFEEEEESKERKQNKVSLSWTDSFQSHLISLFLFLSLSVHHISYVREKVILIHVGKGNIARERKSR